MRKALLASSLFFWLVMGCTSQQSGRYAVKNDSAPSSQQAQQAITDDATPRYEAYRTHNSKPYTVLGKTYYPLQSGKGYEATGLASWYGQKFHGHLTANGETYDMFAMSAAHKTLPLPCYVKVTNLENHKTVIVRVNDRGPFHDNRIIDLSFAAAKKLGTYDNGVSRVKLEVIHVSEDDRYTVGKAPTQSFAEYAGIVAKAEAEVQPPTESSRQFIQVLASSDKAKITALAEGLEALYQVKAQALSSGNLHRLQLGPIRNTLTLKHLLNELKKNGYPSAYILTK